MGLARSGIPASDRRPDRSGLDDRGFIMVVLLVGMAIVAIWMSAALPAWRQQMQRQRELDLIFRGEQYARAIVTYQKKNQGALPPNIDILVQNRYLRKKWKDPITNDDFVPVGAGLAGIERPTTPRGAQAPIAPSIGGTQPSNRAGGPGQQQQAVQGNQPPGVSGVRSKSNETSIRIYEGQQQHSLWPFDAQRFYGRMGYSPGRGGQPGQPGQPGQRGGPGTGRDGQPVGGRPAGPGGGPVGPGGGRDVGPGGAGPVPPPPPARPACPNPPCSPS